MKRPIAAIAALVSTTCLLNAENVINERLSIEGFVDWSYYNVDSEFGAVEESGSDVNVDQVEVSILYDYQDLSAQLDLQYLNDEVVEENEDEIFEQAYASYHFLEGHYLTAGRYASMLGFEAFEPTGRYQYSLAYDTHDLALLVGLSSDVSIIPGYANGVKYVHIGTDTFFGVSIQDEVFGGDSASIGNTDEDGGSFGLEVVYSKSLYYGLTWFVGGTVEEGEAGQGDSYMLNAYMTFDFGAWFFAAEINRGNSESGAFALGGADEEVLQMLLMANYNYSEKASLTGRFSCADHEDDPTDRTLDFTKWTLAHNYAFNDHLALITELSLVDGEFNGTNFENLLGAVELIFLF